MERGKRQQQGSFSFPDLGPLCVAKDIWLGEKFQMSPVWNVSQFQIYEHDVHDQLIGRGPTNPHRKGFASSYYSFLVIAEEEKVIHTCGVQLREVLERSQIYRAAWWEEAIGFTQKCLNSFEPGRRIWILDAIFRESDKAVPKTLMMVLEKKWQLYLEIPCVGSFQRNDVFLVHCNMR